VKLDYKAGSSEWGLTSDLHKVWLWPGEAPNQLANEVTLAELTVYVYAVGPLVFLRGLYIGLGVQACNFKADRAA